VAMVLRRLLKPLSIFIALWCLWLTFRSSEYVVVFPTFDGTLVDKTPVKPIARIAKVSVAVNTLNSSIIHQALRTHQVQNELHGYQHFIATEEAVGDLSENDFQKRPRGAWSKPAYLLSLVVAELMKPECERLKWLLYVFPTLLSRSKFCINSPGSWFDADTVVLNPHTPLEIFLPPESNVELSRVYLLMAGNWDGRIFSPTKNFNESLRRP